MKKVINKNKVRLVFPKYDLCIEPNEIKNVTSEQYAGIIGNLSIEEVLSENKQTNKNNKNKKGRKKKNY